MTLRERAEELWRSLAWLTDDERLEDSERGRGMASIEQAITTAIGAEREACASQLEDRARFYAAKADEVERKSGKINDSVERQIAGALANEAQRVRHPTMYGVHREAGNKDS